MKYSIGTANGDAGEFFFAYQVASVLKWPCRLFDIDIGIDAQVEIINADRISTGRFVAFQIKATSGDEQDCRYVSMRQLNYWRELELPVFVVLVDLSNEVMYLHRVTIDREYSPTKKGLVRIDFDLTQDRFTVNSGAVIAAAAEDAALAYVRKHLAVALQGAECIRETIVAMEDFADPHALIECMDGRAAWKEALAQAGALVSALRVGGDEYAEAEKELEGALQELREYMREWNMHRDWDDDGGIMRFIEEGA
ncbi:DUF4365 domain-containing protein [Chromobacterium haemolyticum]|uniref:DUF4365 domain-containing protein n=1 Tax=Chromobacterium haemolyticum TaxID=394935 RepID=UPI000594F0C7|nr:DUF4365 domain-containing protein [Chromobacterium haemolyticum]